MEFMEGLATPNLDNIVLHGSFGKKIEGTLCITGHQIILSSRTVRNEELWVRIRNRISNTYTKYDLIMWLPLSTSSLCPPYTGIRATTSGEGGGLLGPQPWTNKRSRLANLQTSLKNAVAVANG